MPHVDVPTSLCLAGVARGDVTPPVGMYHRMWGAATHDRSTGVHRPLAATVLIIRPVGNGSGGGDDAVALVALDHCILADADLAEISAAVASEAGVAAQRVHVALSHTHGAGLLVRDRVHEPGGDLIAPYFEAMTRRVAQLAGNAVRGLRPAGITYVRGRCDLAAQRDFYDESAGRFVCGFNPAAAADDTLWVGRIETEDDDDTPRTIATVVNYACHPTTLAWQNTLVSPDFVGAMRETVEAATGDAPCLFLQGASGELGPREQYTGDVRVADRNGRKLGHSVLSALESLPPGSPARRFVYAGAVVSGAVLGTWKYEPIGQAGAPRVTAWRYRSWTVPLRYRPGLPTLDNTRVERDALRADERSAVERGDPAAARDLHARVEQMTRQIMRLEALPPGDAYPLRVTAWQLGDAVWVFVAGEHYSLLQTLLRARFPGVPLLVTTITDGWQPGYLPAAETYGKGIYQEEIAMVAPGSLERVIEEVGDAIQTWVERAS